MFVEFAAVLYERRLTRLERLYLNAHTAYEAAFAGYHQCSDALVKLQAQYDAVSCRILKLELKPAIDTAGGRRSKAKLHMNKREKADGRIGRRLTRVRKRIAWLEKLRIRSVRNGVIAAHMVPQ